MNSIAKKMLLIGFMLLPCACAHYPRHYSYYSGNNGYSSGYTIMHRNYYGERPGHYDNDNAPGKAYFPHHQRHEHYNALPHWSNGYPEHRHRRDRSYDHPFNNESRTGDCQGSRNCRNGGNRYDRYNNFGRGNHH